MNNDAPLKVIINGQEEELSPEEAAELIITGRQTRELETKYNTKFDKVWPDYNRSQQEKAQIEKELTEAREQIKTFEVKKESNTETPKDVTDAKEAARKLGIPFKEDLGEFIKKDDLDKYYDEREAKKRATDEILATADKFEKDINGSDGRPEFNKKAVLAYASAYGFKDLMEAYEDMNSVKIDSWKEAAVAAQKAKSLKTLGTGGKKEPSTPKINKDNFSDALHEALSSTEE